MLVRNRQEGTAVRLPIEMWLEIIETLSDVK